MLRLEMLEDRIALSIWTVTSPADDGDGSLRAVIADAQNGDQIVFDHSLLGHARSGDRGLIPLDRLQIARHRAYQHLVHARDRNDLEPALDVVRDFDKILGVLFGMSTVLMPPRKAASSFSLRPAIGHTRPRRVISPVIATSRRTGIPVITDTIAVTMATPAEGPSFGVAPSGTWMWMSRSSNKGGSMPKATARERT